MNLFYFQLILIGILEVVLFVVIGQAVNMEENE
jgi:hypothetical protein